MTRLMEAPMSVVVPPQIDAGSKRVGNDQVGGCVGEHGCSLQCGYKEESDAQRHAVGVPRVAACKASGDEERCCAPLNGCTKGEEAGCTGSQLRYNDCTNLHRLC